jgi:hypothetical protein
MTVVARIDLSLPPEAWDTESTIGGYRVSPGSTRHALILLSMVEIRAKPSDFEERTVLTIQAERHRMAAERFATKQLRAFLSDPKAQVSFDYQRFEQRLRAEVRG